MNSTAASIPRIIISALRGGSGKTILSLGLTSLWMEQGLKVAPFKKGPDFIDAGWLTFAAGTPCYNLDAFLMTAPQILSSFLDHAEGSDISIIEGNRGLFDGLDVEGCSSTAELAKLLKTPVILVVDVSMATRTVAALVKGCQAFDPALGLGGVILNRVAGPRQESLVREAVETYCGIPVLGAIPKLKGNPFPERHMGLVPTHEREESISALRWARETVDRYLDMERILDLARRAGKLAGSPEAPVVETRQPPEAPSLRIGYILDPSFWFYYPENLESLQGFGARLVQINSFEDARLPEDIDALYIGGGFPETQARYLADNVPFRESLRKAVEGGLPVYAECGGLMYLGKMLHYEGTSYPMVGALPMELILEKRPQGHGYTILEAEHANPYFSPGEVIRGHEFHYSRPVFDRGQTPDFVFKVRRGHGIDGRRDGILKKNLLATYTHVHAGGFPDWGKGLIRTALARRGGGFLPRNQIKD
ncbi:MAG: hydrogenobyrinic acid a,c-diamide synthase (glutamine-hydrolyzing) [Deltaproteobacteria bacterium]|nr:hydrogenobyrinic acid a,c-diamide synthase (glutamine-hydrolyzing) [Deltaproteobacteria bacterium]MBW1948350.1 hydrogenobyrinic acid a,c-diamide synthase (glutamine-hydrolyzing) [Deltaproteobacteria bacterium]MBW2347214.1 hydrogenobyrinic acid a,c-diamide synthase (glutamine-hydrolyzing) [Deltaproteobacteria bacterium]RLB40653.1 MAG: cobyrinic acid a,c-diamide synthase [Deltaproteobacteria bacterium]